MRAEDVTEETLASVRQLILVMGRTVPVTIKGYVKLLKDLARDLHSVCFGAEVTTKQLSDREPKLSDSELMVQLLSE